MKSRYLQLFLHCDWPTFFHQTVGKIIIYMGVSKNGGTPKSCILIGFSIINHPFWGTPIFGNHPYSFWWRNPFFILHNDFHLQQCLGRTQHLPGSKNHEKSIAFWKRPFILVRIYKQQFQGTIFFKMVFDFQGMQYHVFWNRWYNIVSLQGRRKELLRRVVLSWYAAMQVRWHFWKSWQVTIYKNGRVRNRVKLTAGS